MTQPQVIPRSLTFNFYPSVSSSGAPNIADISVLPLSSSPNQPGGATFAGGLQTTTLELTAQINSWTINLIPSQTPGLLAPIMYRVLWRIGTLGPTTTYDFYMPDQNLTFDQLMSTTANIISGQTYVQQTDMGVPGGVARLDSSGNVLTSTGVVCATEADIATVTASVAVETNRAEAAETALNTALQTLVATQVSSTLSTAEAYTDSKLGVINNEISNEAGQRLAGDQALTAQVTAIATQQQTNTAGLNALQAEIPGFATLTGGVLTTSQIPSAVYSVAYPTANQTTMLALTGLHQGDLAVRPDGTFFLNGTNPAILGNWVELSTVLSVNGHVGAVTLQASDVGAIPAGGSVTMSQVTGLNTALLGKANESDLVTLQGQVTQLGTIASNPLVLSFLQTGLLTDGAMPADVAFINTSGQVTNKQGVVVAGGSGSGGISEINGQTTPIVTLTLANVAAAGGSIPEAQVINLVSDLAGKVNTTDASVTNARTPTAHAASHAANGSDPVALSQSQVAGLSGIISGNALTSTSNVVNRVSTLEGLVAGGGGGGGGVGTQAVFYSSSNTTTDVTNFSLVNLHSPWGIDSDGSITGTKGTPYYLYTGVRPADVAYPTISPNGHLHLYQWNESGPADPTYALQSDLTALTTTVSNKANESDLLTLSTFANTLATQTALNQTNNNVAAIQAAIPGFATLTNGVLTSSQIPQISQANVVGLATTLSGYATTGQLTTTNNNVAALQSAAAGYATLTAGVLTSSQIPQVPQANVVGLSTTLAGYATLTGGVLTASQIPTNIPQASVTGLSTALSNCATLTGGVLTASQIPPQALPQFTSVANQAAMLALTGQFFGAMVQVQSGTGAGTYILTGSPASSLASWTAITASGTGSITSVNGYTGPTVVLSYTDVGAMAANATPAASSAATGSALATQLATFATSSSLTSGLAAKTAFSDVQNMLTASSFTKRADYVSTSAVASPPATLQGIDGVTMAAGATVLLTAQPSSVQNGLWVVTAGNWTRPADYATGSYIAKDTLVFVSNQQGTANGAHNGTIWQTSAASGFIDTAQTIWTNIGFTAPQLAPVQANGITITPNGNTPSIGVTVPSTINAPTGGGTLASGLQLNSAGVAVDPNTVPRKKVVAVPAANPATVTHGLGTSFPSVTVWNTSVSPAQLVICGVTVSDPNNIALSFQNTPTTGQYQTVVIG